MMQDVVADDRPEIGLSVVVLRTADNKAEILRVLAPLGVLLPNGLGLNVDGKDIGRAYFVRCFEDGCYAEVILEDELLKTLRAQKNDVRLGFVTTESTQEMQNMANEAGALFLIAKPFTAEQFQAALKPFLG